MSKLIAIEGLDGAGKGTVITKLYRDLISSGVDCETIVEPGTTPLSMELRRLVKYQETSLIPSVEAMLFAAARIQGYYEVVAPALASGRLILSDRSSLSMHAYQGAGLGIAGTCDLIDAASQYHRPDLTIYLDISAETSLKRIAADGRLDSIEARGAEFLNRARDRYLEECQRNPGRCILVDSERAADVVYEDVKQLVVNYLNGG